MVTRIHFEDADDADRAAEQLFAAGHEVAIVRERFAGEDDDEAIDHVVATTASGQEARAALPDLPADTFIAED